VRVSGVAGPCCRLPCRCHRSLGPGLVSEFSTPQPAVLRVRSEKNQIKLVLFLSTVDTSDTLFTNGFELRTPSSPTTLINQHQSPTMDTPDSPRLPADGMIPTMTSEEFQKMLENLRQGESTAVPPCTPPNHRPQGAQGIMSASPKPWWAPTPPVHAVPSLPRPHTVFVTGSTAAAARTCPSLVFILRIASSMSILHLSYQLLDLPRFSSTRAQRTRAPKPAGIRLTSSYSPESTPSLLPHQLPPRFLHLALNPIHRRQQPLFFQHRPHLLPPHPGATKDPTRRAG
jgi:hypothetical protein